jgi:hypothetical protein
MNMEELERDHKWTIERYENIRQVYLASDNIDNDWTNARIDMFIDKENKLYEKGKRMYICEERRRLHNLKKHNNNLPLYSNKHE